MGGRICAVLALLIGGCVFSNGGGGGNSSGNGFTNELGHKYPLLVNYCPSINALSHEDELAKWDIIIVPPDNLQRYHSDWFERIKKQNPKLKILLYVSCMEIPTSASTPGQPWSWLYSGIKDEWWLKDASGNHVEFWPGAWMLNTSSQCPVVNGETWVAYLADYLSDEHLSSGLWDGIFLDCCWDGLSQIGKQVDANRDGHNDQAQQLDSWWYSGMNTLVNQLRQRNPDILIFGNGDGMYSSMNGLMSETYPKGGSFEFIEGILKQGRSSHVAMINCSGNQNDLQKMRYGLCTALMLDNVYFSYDAGEWSHAEAWWYDEYNNSLGKPKGSYLEITGSLTSTSAYFDDFSSGFGNYESESNATLASGKIRGYNSDHGQEWTNFLDSKFTLASNTNYTISFDYAVEQAATKFYCEIVRFGTGKEWLKVENFYSGSGTVEASFATNSYNDWLISFGIQGVGSVLIDNIRVEPETGRVLRRDYEKGIVLVNTSSSTKQIVVGSETITLQGKDGKILLK